MQIPAKKTPLKKKTWVKRILLIFFLWFFTHTLLISIDGMCDETAIADVAVVMGNKVNEDGTLSARLKSRLDRCITLAENKQVKKIIVSGGLGKEGFYEGDKMKEYLKSKGIADSLIITDNKGNNTLLTVKNAMALNDSLQFNSVIVVSQFYHISRSKMLFRHYGIKNVSGVSPSFYEWRDFYSLTREFFGYYLWWI